MRGFAKSVACGSSYLDSQGSSSLLSIGILGLIRRADRRVTIKNIPSNAGKPISNFERWVSPLVALELIFDAARLALQPEIKVEGTEND
ncbi:hypothetical protein [Ruegeria arenilitoris]|uniref:hypothetical protein n=1 Tax=Ruegeria arenilitoris TaxID=1173585 RepID=UPI00147C8251|nr:hypothetical protein [Ruegeria arenilitoris]